MRKRIFGPIKIGGATALIAITSFLSYGIGLIRDKTIAFQFGTTNATDAYNASFLIPDILFNLFIAGALSAAFLPIFSDQLVKDKKEAQIIANTMLTSATLFISLIAITAFFSMGHIVPIIFPKIDASLHTDIINMTRIMLASAILFAISNTLGNILMSYKHFLSYALSPILYNLGIILGIIFLKDSYGIYSAAIGVVIGALLHCIIRVIDAFNTDFKYKPQLQLKHPQFIKIIKLMIPKSIGLISWQINLFIYSIVGITLIEGGFTAFNYARNIQSFSVSLFGIAFATAVFPYLTSAIGEGDNKKYTDHIQKTMQRILFFTIPAAVGVMILATPLTELILAGGEFKEESTRLTATILFFFGLSIPFEGLSHIVARAFYALKNTITPMKVQIVSMFIIGGSTIYLAPKYGIEWFSIGFTIGFAFYVFVMLFFLRKELKGFKIKIFGTSLLKTIIASSVMAVILLTTSGLSESMPLRLAHLLRIGLGAGTFFITAFFLKSSEISSINYIINRIFKKSPA